MARTICLFSDGKGAGCKGQCVGEAALLLMEPGKISERDALMFCAQSLFHDSNGALVNRLGFTIVALILEQER